MNADAVYHVLFSNPSFIECLLGFIPELAAEHLDFSNLQRENIKHHHEDLTRKEGDIAIQLRYQESQKQEHQKEEIRILLELQSTADPRMPLRLWEYALMLTQRMETEGRRHGHTLPAVVGVVFYTGKQPWEIPWDVRDCFRLSPDSALKSLLPAMPYRVVDINTLSDEVLETMDHPLARVIQAEKTRDPNRLGAVIHKLTAWIRACTDVPMRQALRSFVREFVWHGPVQGLGLHYTREQLEEMMEDPHMDWNEKFRGWEQEWLQEGEKKGEKRGKQEGLEEGEERGKQEGFRHAVKIILISKFQKAGEQFWKTFLEPCPKAGWEDILSRIGQAQSLKDLEPLKGGG